MNEADLLIKYMLKDMKSDTNNNNNSNENSDTYGRGDNSRVKACRACLDFKQWMKSKPKTTNLVEESDTKLETIEATDNKKTKKECPLDKDKVGRSSWNLLHTMAAYYPPSPTDEQKSQMKLFIHSFSLFYPCKVCGDDLQKDIAKNPPQVDTRQDLSQWWCRIHNVVNEKLGKPVFDCSLVDQRWLTGPPDGSCD